MKWGVGSFLNLLLWVVLLGTGLAQGQMVAKTSRFTVPFEFQVGDKTLAAGDYTVVESEPNVMSLRDAHAHTVITQVTRSVQTARPVEAKLVFVRHEGHYQLVRIWRAQEEYGDELFGPRPRVVIAKGNPASPATGAGSQP